MSTDALTLTDAQRRQLLATRATLRRLLDGAGPYAPGMAAASGALAGIEVILREAWAYNPELHTLRDLNHGGGWHVTCPAGAAAWTQYPELVLVAIVVAVVIGADAWYRDRRKQRDR